MDFHPPKPTLAKRFSFGENKQTTREIVANVVKVRGDWVGTTSEVKIVRQIERITQELRTKII
jgi:hypothetical protein